MKFLLEQATKQQKYSCTLSLISVLDGVGGQCKIPTALPPGRTRYSLYRRLGEPQGGSGGVRKMWPPPGFDPWTVQPVAGRYNQNYNFRDVLNRKDTE